MRHTSILILASAGISHAGVFNGRAEAACGSSNLIQNGDFEAHRHSLKPWDADTIHIIKPGFHSKQAAGIANPKNFTYTELTQTFKGCPTSSNYILTYDQYLSSPTFGEYDSSYALPSVGGVQASFYTTAKNNGTWKSIKQVYPYGAGKQYADFVIGNQPKGGIAKLDNIVVKPYPKYSVKSNAPNQVKNPGFESGSLSPYTNHAADKYCKIKKPGVGSNTGHSYECFFQEENDLELYQTVSTTPDQLYEFSFDYVITAKGREWFCSIYYHLGNWDYFDGPYVVQSQIFKNGMVGHFKAPFVANDPETLLHITFDGIYGGLKDKDIGIGDEDTCRFNIDNISLRPAHT